MNKFLSLYEDLWVAITVAEAGEYENLSGKMVQPRSVETVRIHAA